MKNLKDLNIEELKLVFENNSKLQEKVFDDMFNNADFWCSEYLDCWESDGIDYCISWDRGTYFKCTDKNSFLAGLEKAQEWYCFLADEYDKTIKCCRELINKTYYLSLSETNLKRLENRIDELIEELENACYNRFMSEYEYCFDSKNQLEYFLDFYAAERMDEDFYIDKNYLLYEHVEYIKSYN